jgi:hypothetical protein
MDMRNDWHSRLGEFVQARLEPTAVVEMMEPGRVAEEGEIGDRDTVFSGGLTQIHLAAGSRSTQRHYPVTNGGGILIHLVHLEALDPRSGPAHPGRQRCSVLPRKV